MSFDAALGASTEQIARKYRLTTETTDKYLKEAAEYHFVEAFQGAIASQLGPLALAVYEQHLLGGNLEAARDILFGLGILGAEKNASSTEGVESITLYRLERKLNGAAHNGSALTLPVGEPAGDGPLVLHGSAPGSGPSSHQFRRPELLQGANPHEQPRPEAGGWALSGRGDESPRDAAPIWALSAGGDAAPPDGAPETVENGRSTPTGHPEAVVGGGLLPRVAADEALFDLEAL